MGSVSSGVSVGVQYLGGGLTDVGAKGVRDAKESVSCEVSCEVSRRCVLQGVEPQWRGVLQGMSSTSCDESLSGGVFLWNRGNKVKFSSLGYIAKNNEYTD